MSIITTVILNDFETGKRIITLINQEDIDFIKQVWNNKDKILSEMQEHPVFAGRERWCDLDPKHYSLMMISMLNVASTLSNEERIDTSHKAIRSLHFLYGALIYCLQTRTDSLIEMIRINRIANNDITYDYTATFNIFEGLSIKKPDKADNELRLVVDNDKEPE